MKYGDIAAIFLAPLADTIDAPDVTATPARRLRDALEPIATQGWWSPQAGARLDALGVDFLPGYVWGRAAALGSPTASVVAATFGVFEPGLIAAVYEAGICARAARGHPRRPPKTAARRASPRSPTRTTAAAVADPLLAVLADLDGLGRPLFSALRSLPVPTSPAGRLWRAAELVREHRGDGHLAALVAAGLTAVEANVLTERWLGFGLGEYSATRGFGPLQLGAAVANLQARGWMDGDDLTDRGRAARVRIEEVTDASQEALIEGCGAGLDGIIARAGDISTRLVAARAFPADPRKRAGG